jgi:hypothetical protein
VHWESFSISGPTYRYLNLIKIIEIVKISAKVILFEITIIARLPEIRASSKSPNNMQKIKSGHPACDSTQLSPFQKADLLVARRSMSRHNAVINRLNKPVLRFVPSDAQVDVDMVLLLAPCAASPYVMLFGRGHSSK